MPFENLTLYLNSKHRISRIFWLKQIRKNLTDSDLLAVNQKTAFFNCNLKSFYSGYKYTPSLAVFNAFKNGVGVISLCDNSSTIGGIEVQKACNVLNKLYYLGFETYNKLIFGQKNYIVKCIGYGVNPKTANSLHDKLSEYRKLKLDLCVQLSKAINTKFNKFGINISYDLSDVKKLIKNNNSTYSYFLFYTALAKKIAEKYSNYLSLCSLLNDKLKLNVKTEDLELLENFKSPFFIDDLAKILKDYLPYKKLSEKALSIEHFAKICTTYNVISTMELDLSSMNIDTAINIAKYKNLNGISCDILDFSLDKIIEYKEKCLKNNLILIVRNNINHPRKKFDVDYIYDKNNKDGTTTQDQNAEKYNEILDYIKQVTLAIVGHSISVSCNSNDGLFSYDSNYQNFDLEKRISLFSHIGQKGYNISEL